MPRAATLQSASPAHFVSASLASQAILWPSPGFFSLCRATAENGSCQRRASACCTPTLSTPASGWSGRVPISGQGVNMAPTASIRASRNGGQTV